jgi:MFS superfamily sulfate permease-like transporter
VVVSRIVNFWSRNFHRYRGLQRLEAGVVVAAAVVVVVVAAVVVVVVAVVVAVVSHKEHW